MTRQEALDLVEARGILLESARGHVTSLAEILAGEPIERSWWSHPAAEEIFRLTRAVRSSEDVLVCRLIDGKITYVHRRLWPALVALADRLDHARLGSVTELHTSAGHHEIREAPFPEWVPAEVARKAARLSVGDADAELRTALGAGAELPLR